jgi:hypothetical protein
MLRLRTHIYWVRGIRDSEKTIKGAQKGIKNMLLYLGV